MTRSIPSFAASVLLIATQLSVASAQSAAATPQATQARDSAKHPLDAIVAVVGDAPITKYDVADRLNQKISNDAQQGRPRPSDPAVLRAMIDSVIGELVDEELMLVKAKDFKVEVPDGQIIPEVNRQYRETRERFQSEAEFRNALVAAGLGTPDEYRRYLTEVYRRRMLFSMVHDTLRFMNKLIPVNVTDEEVAKEFEALKGAIPARPALVSWRQIVVAPSPSEPARARARAKTDSLLVEIRAGGDFERIAKRESMDPETKETGGDRGWARRGMHEAEFDAVVFGTSQRLPLKPGDVSGVIETPRGFQIVRVDRVQPGEVKTRYVLIKPTIDSTDIARTGRLADSVAALIRAGTSPDSLIKQFHDYAGDESAGLISNFERPKLPSEYQASFSSAKIGDVVSFQITGVNGEKKYVVAQITGVSEGGPMTLGEVKEKMREELSRNGAIRRYLDQIKKQTYVVVHAERAYSLATPSR